MLLKEEKVKWNMKRIWNWKWIFTIYNIMSTSALSVRKLYISSLKSQGYYSKEAPILVAATHPPTLGRVGSPGYMGCLLTHLHKKWQLSKCKFLPDIFLLCRRQGCISSCEKKNPRDQLQIQWRFYHPC